MLFHPTVVAIGFIPAGLGLLNQVIQPQPLPQRLLALALLLIVGEQAHMARTDLRQVAAVRQQQQDPRLPAFTRLLWATIAGELLGFYLAAAGFLGVGMVVIVGSVLGFNLAAQVRFEEHRLQPAGPSHRWSVLVIDTLALALGGLWFIPQAQLGVAGLLLTLALIYSGAKLITYTRAGLAASAIHIPHATQQHPQPSQQNSQSKAAQ
jgi:hypothetical protein